MVTNFGMRMIPLESGFGDTEFEKPERRALRKFRPIRADFQYVVCTLPRA